MKMLKVLSVFLPLFLLLQCAPDRNELITEGRLLRQAGKYSEALENFKAALKMKKDAEVYKEIGNVYLLGHHDFEKAEQYYLNSLSEDPEYINALHNMGLLRLQQYENSLDEKGQGNEQYLERASDWFAKVRKIDPYFQLTLQETGKVLFYREKYDEAIELLQETIKRNERSPIGYSIIGQIYLKGKNRPEEAERYLTKAYSLNPDNAEISFYLAQTYGRLDQRDKAEYYYDRYLNLVEKKAIDKEEIEAARKNRENITGGIED